MKKCNCYVKVFFTTLLICACLALTFCLSACGKELKLSDSVSEYRKNILVGTQDGYTLTALICDKEAPYRADGIKANVTELVELRLTTQDNTCDYTVHFDATVNGKSVRVGGETAFDAVHKRFTLTLNAPDEILNETVFFINDGAVETELTARSLLKEDSMGLNELLDCAYKSEKEYFDRLIADKTFLGELHVRLLNDADDNYYYVGVIGKDKTHLALLIDAKTGKIISKKTVA